MSMVEVKVPDIGDFKEVEVIELMVKPGDTIKVDQSLVTVESDKASMEIPSSHAGIVKELNVIAVFERERFSKLTKKKFRPSVTRTDVTHEEISTVNGLNFKRIKNFGICPDRNVRYGSRVD